MKKICIISAVAALLCMGAMAQAATINFDDIDLSVVYNIPVPGDYKDFTWSGFMLIEGADLPGTGYDYGTKSPKNVAYTYNIGSIYRNTVFDLESAWCTSVFENDNNITVAGYLGAEKKYELKTSVGKTAARNIDFDFLGIDKVVFTAGNSSLAMDDIIINDPVNSVPEPATLLGFGLPMLMVGLGKLRGLRK